jgi:hypothetical protein
LRRRNRWIIPALIIGIVVVGTLAFTLGSIVNHNGEATGPAIATYTPPAATGTPPALPTATHTPPTRPTVPLPTSTIARATPRPTAPAATAPVRTATPIPSASDSIGERAAEMLAAMQLGHTPNAADPTVRAFSRDLAAMQPICNASLLGVAGDIVTTHNRLQGLGAQGSLLDTASQLRTFVVNAAKTQSALPPDPCSSLFGAYTRYAQPQSVAKNDHPGDKGGDHGRDGGGKGGGKHGKGH